MEQQSRLKKLKLRQGDGLPFDRYVSGTGNDFLLHVSYLVI